MAGAVLYSGEPNEKGAGLVLRGDLERRFRQGAVRIEAAGYRLTGLGGTCTLGVPGACYPESPPPSALSLAAVVAAPAAGPVYSILGVGAFMRAPTPRHASWLDAGVEIGAGVRLGPRVDLELRVVALGNGATSARLYPLVARFAL